jgi:hypothetical protein
VSRAEPVPGQKHIVFLETRCVLHDSTPGNQSGLLITKREACAVVSAANTNPDTKVYLLYTCSIVGTQSDSPEYVKQMFSYPNVRIWKLVVHTSLKEHRWRTGTLWGRFGHPSGLLSMPAIFCRRIFQGEKSSARLPSDGK